MSFNLNKITRETIKGLKPYSSARDEFVASDKEMVFLDANENPFANGVNRYPDPHQRNLKTVIAKQKGISENKILLGNGSDEVLDLLFRVFCEPNIDNIITLPPTYGMYKVLAGINAIENREVLLTNDYQPNTTKIKETINQNTKLLFICSPNNPTGNLIKKDYIKNLLVDFNGIVVVDEAYIDFASQESMISWLAKYPNLVIVQTLSKAYGMAGIRLGICFASEAIITLLKKVKPPYNVNQLTQERALEGFSNKQQLKKQIAEIIQEKSVMAEALVQLPFVEKVYESEANFILVKVDNALQRYNQCLEAGIVVRNRSSQVLCDNTLRFTIGSPSENKKLLQALKKV